MAAENHIGLEHEALTQQIIRCAIDVHRQLGPGLLESTYEACLLHELVQAGLNVEQQPDLPVVYKGMRIDAGYRIDLLVEGTVIVELKSVDKLAPIHEAQLITYLRLSNMPVGLLFNFNTRVLKDGLIRRANTRSPLPALRDLRGEQ